YLAGREIGLAAVIWDASDDLRDQERAGTDSIMATSRVVIGAMSHEVRNLVCAAMANYKDVSKMPEVASAEPHRVMRTALKSLERIASTGLALSSDRSGATTDLNTVLDETRIVIESVVREAGVHAEWKISPDLPPVQADRHGLLQVFLNLARNSLSAIGSLP